MFDPWQQSSRILDSCYWGVKIDDLQQNSYYPLFSLAITIFWSEISIKLIFVIVSIIWYFPIKAKNIDEIVDLSKYFYSQPISGYVDKFMNNQWWTGWEIF